MSARHLGTVEAVIFDMDGVLIDSEPLWRRAEIAVFASVGLVLTEAECAETLGLRIDEVVRVRHAQAPWQSPSVEDVARTIIERVIELVRAEGEPIAHAMEAVDRVRGYGARLALASSSPATLIAAILERLGLTAAFEVVRSAEDEPFGKPHPAVYLSTARSLSLAPERCVAIEDSLRGVQAAKAARMRCIAVPQADRALFIGQADVVLGSLAELDASTLTG